MHDLYGAISSTLAAIGPTDLTIKQEDAPDVTEITADSEEAFETARAAV